MHVLGLFWGIGAGCGTGSVKLDDTGGGETDTSPKDSGDTSTPNDTGEVEPGEELEAAFTISGELRSLFGMSLGEGDVDGDGSDDLLVGAPGIQRDEDYVGTGAMGEVWLFHGPILPDSHPRSTHFTGIAEGDSIGTAVAHGDFNKDGVRDVAVGGGMATPDNPDASGFVSVVSGPFTDEVALSRGTMLSLGSPADAFGAALLADDITGDGVDDLVVGAPRASSGEILVYAGSELYALGWSVMFTAIATSETDAFGSALASGDVNGDGIADLIVGAPGANGLEDATGAAYLFEGPLLTREADFPGTARGDRMGASVDLDDLDGDGYADAIIGAPGSDNGGLEAGLVTIVAGSSASVVAEEEVTLRGEQAGAQAGTSVAFAHDMNGDGNYDLVVGAPAYDAEDAIDAGRAYLVLGPVEGSHTLAASDHVTGYTTNMRLGLSVLGDTELTGDSMADIVLGGPNTSYPEAEMTGIVLFLAGY